GEVFGVLVFYRSRVQGDNTAAACKIIIEFAVTLLRPLVVPIVENHRIRGLPLVLRRPQLGGSYFEVRPFAKQFFPVTLPCGVVMFVWTMVLGPRNENHLNGTLFFRLFGFASAS